MILGTLLFHPHPFKVRVFHTSYVLRFSFLLHLITKSNLDKRGLPRVGVHGEMIFNFFVDNIVYFFHECVNKYYPWFYIHIFIVWLTRLLLHTELFHRYMWVVSIGHQVVSLNHCNAGSDHVKGLLGGAKMQWSIITLKG